MKPRSIFIAALTAVLITTPLAFASQASQASESVRAEPIATKSGGGAPQAFFQPALEAGQVAKFTGAATYSYDLDVPTGAGGLSIPLGLRYSSDLVASKTGTGNADGGWLGVGWSLDVGRVELTGGTVGDHRLVVGDTLSANLSLRESENQTCSDTDGWTCESQRLQKFNTEEAQFLRIEKTSRTWRKNVCSCTSSCGSSTPIAGWIRDDAQFQVWNKSGVRYEFGADGFTDLPWNGWSTGGDGTSSRAYHLQHKPGWGPDHKEAWIRAWGLERIVDPHGNMVEVDWKSHSSDTWNHNCTGMTRHGFKEIYPQHIRYTTNPAAGDTHAEWQVEFLTSGKSLDTKTSWGLAQSGVQLDGIKVWFHPVIGSPVLVREVGFEFEQDWTPDEESIRLKRIRSWGKGGKAAGDEQPAQVLSYQKRTIRWNNADDQRWFLTAIDNGYGATMAVAYTDHTDDRYLKPVVATRTTDPGLGLVTSSTFSYSEAKSFLEDDGTRRLIGFSRVEETFDNRRVITSFHATTNDDEHPLTGKRLSEKVEELDGTDRGKTAWTWTASERFRPGTSTNAGWFVYVSEEKSRLYTESGEEFNKRTTYDYDPASQGGAQFGNLVAVREYDSVSATTPFRSTWRPHAANTGAWIVDKPRLEVVYEGDLFSSPWAKLTRYVWQPSGTPDHDTVGDRGLLYAERRFLVDDAGNEISADTRHTYDAFGNATGSTVYGSYGDETTYATGDPRTATTTYDSDHHKYPIRAANPLGHTVEYHYYHVNSATANGQGLPGQLQMARDVANDVWQSAQQYDGVGRMTHSWNAGTLFWSESQASTVKVYDDTQRSEETRTRSDQGGGLSGAEYLHTWKLFDGQGREVQAQHQWSAGEVQLLSSHYTADGQLRRQTVPVVVAASGGTFDLASWGDLALPAATFDYDLLGRLLAVTQPGGQQTTYSYPGPWGEVSEIDERGVRERVQQFDTRGRWTYTLERDLTTGAEIVTEHEQDILTRTVGILDDTGNLTAYLYDELGRLLESDDPDRGWIRNRYDALGNLVESTNAVGQSTCFYYDLLNRPVAKAHDTGACPTSIPSGAEQVAYDSGPYGVGRLASTTNADARVSYGYNNRGQKILESMTISGAPATYTTGYTYDESGRPDTMTYPDGRVASYGYDSHHGRPTSLTVDGFPYVVDSTYTERGDPATRVFGNGLTTRFSYWGAGHNFRLERLRTGDASVIDRNQYLRYWYDPAGNTRTLRDYHGAKVSGGSWEEQDFEYDFLDRLTRARTTTASAAAYDHGYEYNALGNLVELTDHLAGTVETYGYDSQHVHALKTVNGATRLLYDNAGRSTQRGDGGSTYYQGWDAENRLRTVTSGSAVTQLGYDWNGALVKKSSGLTSTFFIGGHFEVSGSTTRSYYHFDGRRVGLSKVDGLTEERFFIHGDNLHSAHLITDTAGNTHHESSVAPFGARRFETGTEVTDIAFTGEQRHDDLGGIYKMGVRFYDPVHRHWLSPDSLIPDPEDSQALNRYSYVGNNPVRFIDPSGHCGTPPRPSVGDFLDNLKNDVQDAVKNNVDAAVGWARDEGAAAAAKVAGGVDAAIDLVSTIDSGVSLANPVLHLARNIGKTDDLPALLRESAKKSGLPDFVGMGFDAYNFAGGVIKHTMRYNAGEINGKVLTVEVSALFGQFIFDKTISTIAVNGFPETLGLSLLLIPVNQYLGTGETAGQVVGITVGGFLLGMQEIVSWMEGLSAAEEFAGHVQETAAAGDQYDY